MEDGQKEENHGVPLITDANNQSQNTKDILMISYDGIGFKDLYNFYRIYDAP